MLVGAGRGGGAERREGRAAARTGRHTVTFQALGEFTCVPEFKRKETTFDLHVKGRSGPVARVRKAGVTDSLRPYAVYEGPDLDQAAGWVNAYQAGGAEGGIVGEVQRESRALAEDHLSVSHAGLPALKGRPEGLQTRVTRTFPVNVVAGTIGAGYVLATRYRFSAPGCAGFSVGRKQGVRSAYTVKIRDPRINRLVPLMCVVHIAEQLSGDVRQGLANMTSNPFKT
ncbi:hypothetical protein [Streptomyces sp. CA-111067]|uniref:hypothetical protein n=1 Tax=Streptomyces sp. CA-111067 TaxID=3240046 RepID=UPI003D99B107